MKNKLMNILTGGGGTAEQTISRGFTMAEILLSLTIIGVVAAITLPSLTGNINERTWNTQRKALYARMSQAIALMPALNGFGTLTEDASGSVTEDTAAETFITAGLAKVLKINNICDNEHLADCGIVTSYNDMLGTQKALPTTLYSLSNGFKSIAYSGSSFSTINTKAAAFETANGESIVAYYNQSCRSQYLSEESVTQYGNTFGFAQSNMCVNFIYDLNGSKGPNTVGKDIGIMTVFNAADSTVVAPLPASSTSVGGSAATYSWYDASKACTSSDSESRLPNIDELCAMEINRNIVNLTSEVAGFWSSSVFSAERAWFFNQSGQVRATDGKASRISVRCVKR
ncbi:MAG: prepilin-type N-terminal cleavage/methylation domain-containing protein [Fusobacterium sp.]|nr:prepilin-type N-terminal cleavage/methylation domain-containing protein [Fusobacterium sp.]